MASLDRTPEVRRERPRLAPRAPLIETTLATFNLDGFDIEETRRWGNALAQARDSWADHYRGGRRYSDRDLAQQQNSLVRRDRGGAR